MKQRLSSLFLIAAVLSGCGVSPEAEKIEVIYSSDYIAEDIAVSPRTLYAGVIVADKETALKERERIALSWAERAVCDYFESSGTELDYEYKPEILLVSESGKVAVVLDDEIICLRSDEDNILHYCNGNIEEFFDNEVMLIDKENRI